MSKKDTNEIYFIIFIILITRAASYLRGAPPPPPGQSQIFFPLPNIFYSYSYSYNKNYEIYFICILFTNFVNCLLPLVSVVWLGVLLVQQPQTLLSNYFHKDLVTTPCYHVDLNWPLIVYQWQALLVTTPCYHAVDLNWPIYDLLSLSRIHINPKWVYHFG